MKKTVLREYAKLIAKVGANVQKGQEVFITAELDQPEFVAMLVDECYKLKAKKGWWRIPEATLLMLAVIGGSIGAWCGMMLFRHKTKHWKFKLGVPVIILLQFALLVYVYVKY